MYNGIGIPTPRGSGTSGYVVTNRAHVKAYGRYPMNSNVYGQPAKKLKKANTELVLHEKKRDIERQLLEYRSSLESKGLYTTEQIDEMIGSSRERRFKALEMDMVDRSHFRDRVRLREDREKYGRKGSSGSHKRKSFQKPKQEDEKEEQFNYYGRSTTSSSSNNSERKSHSSREAQDRKNRVLARALGINQRQHVVGESFRQIGEHNDDRKDEDSDDEGRRERRKRKRYDEIEDRERRNDRKKTFSENDNDEEEADRPRKKQKLDHVYQYHTPRDHHHEEEEEEEERGLYARERRPPRVTDAERRRKRELEEKEGRQQHSRRRYDDDRRRRYDDYDDGYRRERRSSYRRDDEREYDNRRRRRRSESPKKKEEEKGVEKKDEK